jgi:hypothetical protein
MTTNGAISGEFAHKAWLARPLSLALAPRPTMTADPPGNQSRHATRVLLDSHNVMQTWPVRFDLPSWLGAPIVALILTRFGFARGGGGGKISRATFLKLLAHPARLAAKLEQTPIWVAVSNASSRRCDGPKCSAPKKRCPVPRQRAQTDPGSTGILESYGATLAAIHARTLSRRRRTARSRPRRCGCVGSTTQRADPWRGP